jgi:uncharacterized membrane protein
MTHETENARLEMFCDGVFAIAITILILEIKVPPIQWINSPADLWQQLFHLWPSFFAFILSFLLIFISWMGHHNLLRTLDKTSSRFQAINGFFLFTVIINPFSTALMAEYLNTEYAQPAVFFYCLTAGLLHSIAWRLLLITSLRPVTLTKSAAETVKLNATVKGNLIGLLLNIAITVTAWWFPYVAISMNLFLWIFWIYITIKVKPGDQ